MHTLYIGSLAFICFWTKYEAERYAFDFALKHPECKIAILRN